VYGVGVVVAELVDDLGYSVMIAFGQGIADGRFESGGIPSQLNRFQRLTRKLHHSLAALNSVALKRPLRQARLSHPAQDPTAANIERPSTTREWL